MGILAERLKAAFAKIGIHFLEDSPKDAAALQKEIDDLKAFIKTLIPDLEKGLDARLARAEIEKRIQQLEEKYGIAPPYPGVM